MAYDKSVFDAQIATTIRTALDLQARHDHFGKTISDGDADTLTAALAAASAEMQYLAGGGGANPDPEPGYDFFDSVTRADSLVSFGTPEKRTYTAAGGADDAYGVLSNKLYRPTTTNGVGTLTLSSTMLDGTIEVKVTPNDAAAGVMYILLRYHYASGGSWLAAVVDLPGNRVRLWSNYLGGGVVVLEDSGGVFTVAGVEAAIKVVAAGTSIKVYVDTVLKIDQTLSGNDATIGSGPILLVDNGTVSGFFDDIKVTKVS